MNIDVSNLLSLFSNVGKLGNLNLPEAAEAGSVEGFSEAFIEQIKLLQEQGQLTGNQETLGALQELAAAVETEPLQEFAGLLNDYGKMTASTAKTGQKLPLSGQIEKEINIDETIDTLQDVMQHIAAVSDLVEEKAAEISDVIETVVDFFQADENVPSPHDQIPVPADLAQVNSHDDLERLDDVPSESLLGELSNEDVSLKTESTQPVSQNESIAASTQVIAQSIAAELHPKSPAGVIASESNESEIANLVVDQKNLQQVFNKDFEKAAPINSASNLAQDLTTKEDQAVDAIGRFDHEFRDDMLNKEQDMGKAFSELSSLEKPKQGSFDLTAVHTISETEKPVTTYASDLALLNRQVANNSAMKGELPAMTKPFNDPEWQNEFNERIVWMNNKSISAAEIRLNPQHLGPVSIRIDVNQDQANIAFTAQHGAVREAIEAAIPKLREMLSSQQLNLTEVNVSQQDFSEQRSSSQGFFQGGQKQDGQPKNEFSLAENDSEIKQNAVELTEEIERGRAVASNGLLNIYA